jgi:precorrin-2 dehydrogenase/sirohydrochlorin ferrochelatase
LYYSVGDLLMLPIALDLARLRVILVGRGAATCRRLALLDQAGAHRLAVFSDRPDPALTAAAGARIRRGLPSGGDLAAAAVLLVCDLPSADARALADTARALGLLCNVEDATALCDFHMPAIVRRGDLVLAISTGGKSPGLARALKQWLERLLDARWGERLNALAQRRQRWRARGHAAPALGTLTRRAIARAGWLSDTDRGAA